MRIAGVGRFAPPRLHQGWLVVAAAFLVAMFGFGLGFYGPGVCLFALKAANGWSTGQRAAAITAYYVLGALLLFVVVGPLFDRLGVRAVVSVGTVAMVFGLVVLTLVTRPLQVYAGFGVMSLGRATMRGAAINVIVAPWFGRRRWSWRSRGSASASGSISRPQRCSPS
jgi:MFS family permease